MYYVYLGIAIFCFVHIIRDVLQINYGYKTWFMRIGHVWHAPQYELHGIVVFAAVGLISLRLAGIL
jgi:hypothetical protein